jgi:DNA-binding GntR family transcriptional regulator
LADGVADQIRRAIIDASLLEGNLVPEGQLASQLGTSRGPVREALIQLEREGLVVFDSRGRARIRTLGPDDFEELISLRLTLETMGARLAAKRHTAQDVAAMEENLRQCQSAASLGEVARLDMELHELIIGAARHERLLICWRTIRRQVEWWIARNFRRHGASERETRRLVSAAQRTLFEAVQSGDPKRAESVAAEHIGRWRDLLPAEVSSR